MGFRTVACFTMRPHHIQSAGCHFPLLCYDTLRPTPQTPVDDDGRRTQSPPSDRRTSLLPGLWLASGSNGDNLPYVWCFAHRRGTLTRRDESPKTTAWLDQGLDRRWIGTGHPVSRQLWALQTYDGSTRGRGNTSYRHSHSNADSNANPHCDANSHARSHANPHSSTRPPGAGWRDSQRHCQFVRCSPRIDPRSKPLHGS
jgi:hypothetical protein